MAMVKISATWFRGSGKEAERSLAKHLTSSLIIAVGLVSIFTFLVLYRGAIHMQEAELQRNADVTMDYLVGALEVPLWNYDTITVKTICRTLHQNDRVLGLVVKDNFGTDIVDISEGFTPAAFSRSGKIFHQGELAGEVRIYFTKRFVQDTGRRLFFIYATTILVVLLTIALLTHHLVRRFLKKPLARLDAIARPYAEGIYDIPADALPYAEFQPFGRVLSWMGETISAQMRERREAEEKYRSIFENAIEGIYQSMPEGSFLNVNPAFAGIFGFASPEELIMGISDIGHQLYVNPVDRDRIIQDLQNRVLVRGVEVEMFHRDGGKVWVSVNARAVCDQDGKILYFEGSLEDITKRKQYEQELRKLNDELEQRVLERTVELEAKNTELERLNKLFVGRELRMMELKQKIQELQGDQTRT